jgi:hypothetical protein
MACIAARSSSIVRGSFADSASASRRVFTESRTTGSSTSEFGSMVIAKFAPTGTEFRRPASSTMTGSSSGVPSSSPPPPSRRSEQPARTAVPERVPTARIASRRVSSLRVIPGRIQHATGLIALQTFPRQNVGRRTRAVTDGVGTVGIDGAAWFLCVRRSNRGYGR